MTEINKNDAMNNIPAVKPAAPAPKADALPAANLEENSTKQLQDLGNNPQEAIGRSQVAKADNLAHDMEVLKNNPKLVQHADEFFDYTLAQLEKEGRPDAYEKACLATAQFINEFSKKPQIQV